MNAVDTNVLVYFVDKDEPTKRAKAVAVLDSLAKGDVETLLL
jgi:predicted nucleic acid-binding protein